MRSSLIVGAVAIACGLMARNASATLIAYDSFSYTAGSGALANQNGGTGWSTTWGTGTNNVVSPGLTYSANGATLVTAGNTSEAAGSGIENSRLIPSVINTGTVYVSFLAKLDSGTAGSSYAGIALSNNGNEHLFIGQPNGASYWGTDVFGGQQLTSYAVNNTTHLFVIEITVGGGPGGDNLVRLYVDPTPGLSSPDVAPALDLNSANFTGFNNIVIQDEGSEKIAYDELRIATDYASVVPAAVPEPASLSLAALGAAALLFRRRRI